MTTTLEHLQAPRRSASAPTARRTTPAAAPTAAPAAASRTGLLAMFGEAIAAARAVSTADPRTSVAVAARFAARINA